MSNLDRMQAGLTIEPPDGCSCPGGFAFMGGVNLVESISGCEFSRERSPALARACAGE